MLRAIELSVCNIQLIHFFSSPFPLYSLLRVPAVGAIIWFAFLLYL